MSENEQLPGRDGVEASRWVFNARNEPESVLARYVSQPALEGTELRLRDAPAVRRAATGKEHGDVLVARKIYEKLLTVGISASWEEWAARWVTQPIRHPAQIAYDRHADCLDLALLYAGLCQAALVPALLALVKGHAFVLVQPGRFEKTPSLQQTERWEDAWPPIELEGAQEGQGEEAGVHRVSDLVPLQRKIDAGELVPVDIYSLVHRASFDQAVESGQEALEGKNLRIIDVPWLHSQAQTVPVKAPARLVEMSPYIPGGDDLFVEHPSRKEIATHLGERNGVVVLLGASGTGKSVLARHLAATAKHGAGWFLNASQPQSLINGLARAHLARRELEPGGSDEKDREEHAMAALVALRVAPHPWVVVLDNADGDPGPLTRWIPSPDRERGQLVIVTSLNGKQWREQSDVEIVELEPLAEEDVRATLKRSDLVDLAEGRPLLIDSFARLLEVTEEERLERAIQSVAGREMEAELRGPAIVWAAVRASAGFDEEMLKLAASISMLPPDHQPLGALRELDHDADSLAKALAQAGLVSLDETGIVSMHRLFGQVVREDIAASDPSVFGAQALALALSPETMRLFETHGDQGTTTRLAEAVRAMPGDGLDRSIGLALHGLGRLLELQGDSMASAASYERAQPHLEDPLLIADCLHGRARAVNQHETGKEERIGEAIDWSEQAQALIESRADPNKAGRCVAMRGLLLQKLAAFDSRREDRRKLLDGARELIEDAHERRLADLDHDDPELLRSRFNFGGIEINLAKTRPETAAEHLNNAEEAYREVARRRRDVYGVDIHPHVAACHSGLVLVGYYRSTLIEASETQRSTWLRDATENGIEAIRQWEVVEGAADGAEIRKVSARLTKAALARHVRPRHEREETEKLFTEILSELPEQAHSQT